ncbi:MAG: hypothetical protein ACTSRK_07440 [Promethearchaeota archaeon]
MLQKRTRNILIASFLLSTVLVSLFIYNWVEYQEVMEKYAVCEDTSCVRIYGNIQEEVFIGLSDILDGDFDRLENISYDYLNMYKTSEIFNISGIRVWDVLQSIRPILGDVTYFRFEATDGYGTYLIPLRLVEAFPDDFLIISHVNGIPLLTKEEGGDGPLMSAVSMDAIAEDPEIIQLFQDMLLPGFDHVHNSKFSVKYLNAIYLE